MVTACCTLAAVAVGSTNASDPGAVGTEPTTPSAAEALPLPSDVDVPLLATATPVGVLRALAAGELELATPARPSPWDVPATVGSDGVGDPATAPELPEPPAEEPAEEAAPAEEEPPPADDGTADDRAPAGGGGESSAGGSGSGGDSGGEGSSRDADASSGSGSGGSSSGSSGSGSSGSGGSSGGSSGSGSGGSGSGGSSGGGGSGSGGSGGGSSGGGSSGGGGSAPSDPAPTVTPRPELASALASAIASSRADAGRSALQRDGRADAVAQAWAEVMAGDGQLRHNPDYARQLHAAMGSGAVAENVGMVAPADVSRLHSLFMGSAGHRANILGDHTHVGVGAATDASGRLWAVHVFIRLA